MAVKSGGGVTSALEIPVQLRVLPNRCPIENASMIPYGAE
jgi:hypothetical protein